MSLARKAVHTIRNDYTGTPVTTSAYTQLSSSMPQECWAYDAFDSSGQVLKLAVGASGSEVDLPSRIYPGGTDGMMPLRIVAGQRVSIKAVDGNASVGQLVLNFYA
jgi:hypothetical protein